MDDIYWEGAYSSGGVLFMIGCKILSQAKVDVTHGVEYHRKYIYQGAELLLHSFLVDYFLLGGQDSHMNLLRKYF